MAWGSGNPPIAAAEAPSGIQWKSLGPSVATTALATVVVAIRLYTRASIVRALGHDDMIIVVSVVLSIAMCAVVGQEVAVGSTQDYKVHRDTKVYIIAKLVVVNNCLYALITNCTKASILVQYLRIFCERAIRCVAWFLMFLCLAATFWAVFGGVFLCTPVGKLWKPDTPGWCMNAEDYWISAAAINVVLDFAVLILPLPVVSRLRLPKSQKIALLLVFLVGGFGSIVSIVRLSIVHVEAREGHYLESGVAAITWSAVEANTGIICASLLALKPWLVRFFPRLLSPKEPASQCMRLPTIPYTENSTVDSEATLAVLNRPNLSQQTVVIDFAQELAPAFVVKRPSL